MQSNNDKILDQLKKKLRTLAPNARAILFGSRARGDARPASDWDILILLDKENLTRNAALFCVKYSHNSQF